MYSTQTEIFLGGIYTHSTLTSVIYTSKMQHSAETISVSSGPQPVVWVYSKLYVQESIKEIGSYSWQQRVNILP